MKTKVFIEQLEQLGIMDYIGVPDSTLKNFCDYLYTNFSQHHFVTVNEGAAVALAAGMYLGDKKVSCVYMQNSGIGNAINPIASLINEQVYDIPMLFVIGYRGEPGKKDEPQHKFQGEITLPLLECLNIAYETIDEKTSEAELLAIIKQAQQVISQNKQFAIIVKKGSFEDTSSYHFHNSYTLQREKAIREILKLTQEDDLIVSTTGKISREVYEQCNDLFQNHDRAFLTVGSMGHASMIALGIALKNPKRRVICLDGDGAALMHMGSMSFIAHQKCHNLIHITLNNEAHESVGGMPTDCQGQSFATIASACGYETVNCVDNETELTTVLKEYLASQKLTYLEVKVALGARKDLGRPKETAVENKQCFMEHVKGTK